MTLKRQLQLGRRIVLMRVAADYHSGQWSRGYRLLSRCQRFFRHIGYHDPLSVPLTAWQKTLYRELVTKYADKL